MSLGYPALVIAFAVGTSIPSPAPPGQDVNTVSAWAMSNEGMRGHIDHSTWQVLLNQYLDATHRSGIARFDYRRVTQTHHALLNQYIATLCTLDPRTYARGDQKAYWINLYNAQTVRLVVENPDADSIRDIRPSWFSSGPWKAKDLVVDDEALSLDDIEHEIVRPVFHDPRMHYALNCASIGCPNLSSLAFTGTNVDTLLANAEHAYVNHPRAVRFDGDELVLSSIYEWYRNDFARDEHGVIDYLADHHDSLAEKLRAFTGRVRYEYDWSLNQP
jgi:hypothetical protein